MADSPVHSHNQPCICGSVIFGITSNSSMSDELYLTHNQRASAYSGGLSYPGRPAASLRPRKKESREALVRRWSCFPSTYRNRQRRSVLPSSIFVEHRSRLGRCNVISNIYTDIRPLPRRNLHACERSVQNRDLLAHLFRRSYLRLPQKKGYLLPAKISVGSIERISGIESDSMLVPSASVWPDR